jgi:hypothetical protein
MRHEEGGRNEIEQGIGLEIIDSTREKAKQYLGVKTVVMSEEVFEEFASQYPDVVDTMSFGIYDEWNIGEYKGYTERREFDVVVHPDFPNEICSDGYFQTWMDGERYTKELMGKERNWIKDGKAVRLVEWGRSSNRVELLNYLSGTVSWNSVAYADVYCFVDFYKVVDRVKELSKTARNSLELGMELNKEFKPKVYKWSSFS